MARLQRHYAVTRAIDIVLSLAAILFMAPAFLVIAGLILLDDRGPILFRHERIGLGGRRFKCLKFRTMAVDAELRLQALLASSPQALHDWEREHKLRDDPRITPIGVFLRKSSLDELPQFFNILRGDMSLVGPRPIVDAEIARYGKHFRHYCAVRPGLTGLWQVSGRNDVSYRERIVMDVAYVRSKCVTLDLEILVKTVPAVLLRRGSY
jgi:lipopolysaccharide/colanic/teichoic acid biosynthesis glycosyltransferase